MPVLDRERERIILADELLLNPVLMMHWDPVGEDIRALQALASITRPKVVLRPPHTVGSMVLPRLVAGQSVYEGLDAIDRFVAWIKCLRTVVRTMTTVPST